nr:uncharacterized protein LOC123496932 [Aegilops tauschii subsp. strangulata]
MACFDITKSICDDLSSMIGRYWWSQVDKQNKIHWVSWDKLSKPKKDGGMGFGDLYSFNLAMLARQAWKIIQHPSSLCAKVLSAKYFPGKSILEATPRKGISYTWRSILKGLQLLKRGIIWRVGNGKSIKVWTDPWIPRDGTRTVISQKGHNLITKVSELIDPATSSWDANLVRQTFLPEGANMILQIPIHEDIDDFIAWHYDKKVQIMFSIGRNYGRCRCQARCYISYGGLPPTVCHYEQNFNAEPSKHTRQNTIQRWTPPPGIMKLNTDGAFQEETHSGGWGFILRNDTGALIAAGAGNLEYLVDALHSEAWAMLYAVDAAIRMGCDRLIIETDSLLLKQAVMSNTYDLSQLGAIFRDIKYQFRVGLSDVSVKHCNRKCNHAAHTLAAHGTTMSRSTWEIWFDKFPSFVSDCVAGDSASTAL